MELPTGLFKKEPSIYYVHYTCTHCKRDVWINKNKAKEILCGKCDKDDTHYMTRHETVTFDKVPKDVEVIH